MPSTLTWCAVTGVNSDARRQQRGEMEHQLDPELGQHALEHATIENRAGDLAIDPRRRSTHRGGSRSSVTIARSPRSTSRSISP